MRTTARRLGAVALSVTLAAGTALVAPSAQAANNLYAGTAANWLGAQLTNGVVHNKQFDFDDYGLSLDIFFALKSLGRPAAAGTVLDALAKGPGNYVGTGGEEYAGATGKLMTAVLEGKRDPRSFGGLDLVTRLEGLVDTTHVGEKGRGVDTSSFGDFSNTIGQSFVVEGLAGAKSADAQQAADFLLQQQCTAGFFRETFEKATDTSTFTCDAASPAATPSVDSTAIAVESLVAARADGVTGLDAAITSAGTWLVSQQGSNGSYVGNGTPNTNTTGLAAQALVLTGHRADAERAAAFVAKRTVTALVAQDHPRLAKEAGAIAYTSAALSAGEAHGITVDQRDQWQRATAQAAVGVNAVRPLTVTGPTGFLHGGSRAALHVAGLVPGEQWTARIGDLAAVHGTASSTGHATVRLLLPQHTRRYAARVHGVSSARAGKATLRVLGPKTFGLTLRSRPIARGHVQRVTVSGLAPGEHARLFYRGNRIWSGSATSAGQVVRSFGAGSSLGRKKLVLHGLFADRSVTTYFRVVR